MMRKEDRGIKPMMVWIEVEVKKEFKKIVLGKGVTIRSVIERLMRDYLTQERKEGRQ